MIHRIQYVSDGNIENPHYKAFFIKHKLIPKANDLVLVGDIVPFASIHNHIDFFFYLSDNFEFTYWLPENQDYYDFDLSYKSGSFNERIRQNIFFVNNTTITLSNTKLILSILLSRISTGHRSYIEKTLHDFQKIKHNADAFSVWAYNQLHQDNLSFIIQELKTISEDKVAVFSHHYLTFLSFPIQHNGDILNEAYAIELYDLIEDSNISHSVYGHHHTNTPKFSIGSTKILTNQLGYVQLNEHLLWKGNKFFEL